MKTLNLTFRDGRQADDPSSADIAAAIEELFDSVDDEHPNAWLELGSDSDNGWSVVTLDAYQSGLIIFSRWADQDDDDPMAENRKINVNREEMIALFEILKSTDLDRLTEITTSWST